MQIHQPLLRPCFGKELFGCAQQPQYFVGELLFPSNRMEYNEMCHFDMPIALERHFQSLKTTLEEGRTVGWKFNK